MDWTKIFGGGASGGGGSGGGPASAASAVAQASTNFGGEGGGGASTLAVLGVVFGALLVFLLFANLLLHANPRRLPGPSQN